VHVTNEAHVPCEGRGAVERHIFRHKSDARFDPSFVSRHLTAEPSHTAGIGPNQAHQNTQGNSKLVHHLRRRPPHGQYRGSANRIGWSCVETRAYSLNPEHFRGFPSLNVFFPAQTSAKDSCMTIIKDVD
jgi:hypothetical protein